MQRRFLVSALLLALVVLFLTACSTSPKQEQASDTNMDWSRIETPMTLHYQMQDSAQVYGQMKQMVERTEVDGRSVIQATYTVDNGNLNSENMFSFDAATGAPIRLMATQKMQGMEASTEVSYADGKVQRIMKNPMAPQPDTSSIDAPEGVRDWMQVGFILQAADMSSMDTLRVPFYQGFGQAFVDTATLIHAGLETVEVPAGSFQAHRIHILFAGAEADFFVEDAPKPRVIKHQIPGRQGPLATVLIPEESVEDSEE